MLPAGVDASKTDCEGHTGPLWQVALIARSDTRKARTRWRVTAPIDRDGTYGFFATGRRSGYARTQDRAVDQAANAR